MVTRKRLVVVGYALTLVVQAASWADESYVVTPNPAAISTATIGTNYSQTQSFSEPLGFNSNTFAQNPDVYWFTYVSDGKSAVRFDTLGSNFGQSSGGQVLGSTNESEVAVYSTAGSLVAISKNTVDLSGNPIPIYPTFSSSIGTVYGSQPGALGTNQYTPEGLSQVYFAPTASTNPNWTVKPTDPTPYTGWSAPGNSGNGQEYYPPSYYTSLNEYHVWSTALSPIVLDNNGNPVLNSSGQTIPQPGWRYFDYERIGPGSTWNRYQVLPAGTYYIAIGSAQTFAGDTDAVTVLQQPIFYNYNTNQNGPAITSPLTGFQYYDDPTGLQNAGTINLNVTQAPVVTQTVATLSGSANMTLNATTLVVTNGGSYSGVLQDGTFQGLLVVSGGTLTLTGNNTFSGGITLSGSGTLSVAADANLGDPTGAISFDGGSLEITGTSYTSTSRPLYWDSNGGGFNIDNAANTFTVNTSLAGGGLTKSGAGTLLLALGYFTSSPTVVSAGTLQLATAANTAAISGAGTLLVAAGTSLVSDGITTSGLTINGSVQIRSNGSPTGASKVAALTLTGSLDLTNNPLIVEATAITKSTVTTSLKSEVLAGAGHTTGIFSSTLAANEVIAVVDNGLLATPKTTFDGQSVDINSILVTPALIGDVNVDGSVDLSDLTAVLTHLGTTTTAWAQGNFDNAPTVDLTDLNDVLNHLGMTLANTAGSVAATPEPASLGLLLCGTAWMAARRTRSRHS